MKLKRLKLAAIGVLALCLSAQSMVTSAYTKIYETASPIEYYADGVTHQNIKTFTNEGWINLNVLRIDLTKNVEMTVLTDTFFSSRDTITNLVNKNNADGTIVAAINSDFFDAGNSSTMGTLVKDGRVLSTSIGQPGFASFNIGTTGVPFVSYINTPKNTFTNGVTTRDINFINKPYLIGNRVIYYDKTFISKSYGKNLGTEVLEMLVVNNVITDIRLTGEPFVIPDNGYVIAAVGTSIGDLVTKFKVGDSITIKYDVNFRYMDMSIGGGAQLIKDGKIIPFTHNIAGSHPRTGLGITADRKQLILVTVDGRTNFYRGVNQAELANILLQLGAYEGINLDGGGSTEMVAKSPWTNRLSIMNFPSDKAERKMFTALAVKKVVTANPVLKHVKIAMGSTTLLLGSEMSVTLSGIDSNYNAMAIPQDEVTWSVNGVAGTFKNGKFMPTSEGKGVITASYKGVTATQNIVVKKGAVKLSVSPGIIKADINGERQLTFSVLTDEGATITLAPTAVKVTTPAGLGAYNADKGAFIGGPQVTQGYITVEFDGLVTYVPVGVGTDKQLYYDFERPTATFQGYPATVGGSYIETTLNAKVGASGQLIYDFTKTGETRAAYMILNNQVTFPSDTQSIGMWVFGDQGNSHWLRAKVVDSKGTATNLTLSQNVNWTGWRYVTVDLPTNQVAPFQLERVYLVETDTNKLDRGYILIDQIEAIKGQTLSVVTPPDVTRIKNLADYKLPTAMKATSKFMSFMYPKSQTDAVKAFVSGTKSTVIMPENRYVKIENTDSVIVKLNNGGGTIRKNDYKQWLSLLYFAQNYTQKKPVIIMMSDVNTFNDALEKDLFIEQVATLTQRGVDVTVVFTTANDFYTQERVAGANFIKVPRSNGVVKPLSIGVSENKIYFEVTP